MKRTKFLIGYILPLLVLVQLFALQLKGQNNLVKPEKMDRITFRHFEDMVKYDDPDSMIFYRVEKDSQPYSKLTFVYNDAHQPVVEDQYELYDQAYKLKQRTIKTYDPQTGILRQTDVKIVRSKNGKDTIRTFNMFVYDAAGNQVLRYLVDTLEGAYERSNSDSVVYQYGKNGVPLYAMSYYFGFVGSAWIRVLEYKTEGVGNDGNPQVITFSMANTDDHLMPVRQYRSISWDKRCNSFEGIDTLAKEYTEALYYDGKWMDRYKRINFFNARGKVDSSLVYILKNDIAYLGEKDIYTYQGGMDFLSKLHYEYINGNWQLNAGTRRTFSFGQDSKGRYYLQLKEEVYEKPPGTWVESNNVRWY